MKCLFITNIEQTIHLFFTPHLQLLDEMGFSVTVATSIMDRKKLQEKFPNITFHHIPFTRSVHSPTNIKVYRMLKRLLKQEQFDVIHVHTPIAAFLTRMAAPQEANIIYTAHGFHFHQQGTPIRNWMYYTAEKIAAPKTSKLIVMNEDDREKASNFISHEDIHHIHGVGVDAQFFHPSTYTNQEKKEIKEALGIVSDIQVIIHIADVDENKRQWDVIEAATKLKEVYEKFIVLLVGDGPLLSEIRSEISKRGLEQYVKCLGFRKDIRELLSISDIGILVSLREGLPKSVMEMMAMELPLVVTNIRGNRDLVQHGENGLLIPTKSPEELKEALYTLLGNHVLQKQLGVKGREKILAKYDVNIILQETKKVYESVIYDRKEVLKTI